MAGIICRVGTVYYVGGKDNQVPGTDMIGPVPHKVVALPRCKVINFKVVVEMVPGLGGVPAPDNMLHKQGVHLVPEQDVI